MSEDGSSADRATAVDGPVLSVDDRSTDEHLALAGSALARCASPVIFAGIVCILPEAGRLVCEVLDPEGSAHRCAVELEVLVENARRALESSRLRAHLPARRFDWVIREDS